MGQKYVLEMNHIWPFNMFFTVHATNQTLQQAKQCCMHTSTLIIYEAIIVCTLQQNEL